MLHDFNKYKNVGVESMIIIQAITKQCLKKTLNDVGFDGLMILLTLVKWFYDDFTCSRVKLQKCYRLYVYMFRKQLLTK